MDFDAYVQEFNLSQSSTKAYNRLKFAIMRIPEKDRILLGTIFRGDPITLCDIALEHEYKIWSDDPDSKKIPASKLAAIYFIEKVDKLLPLVVYKSIVWSRLVSELQEERLLFNVGSDWLLITRDIEKVERHEPYPDCLQRR